MATEVCENLDFNAFPVPAATTLSNELQESSEHHRYCFYNDKCSVCTTVIDKRYVACFLKLLLKLLGLEQVFEKQSESQLTSEESFYTSTSYSMLSQRWPLQNFISILRLLKEDFANRTRVNGQSFVFKPDEWMFSSEIEDSELQAIFDLVTERLQMTSDVICDGLILDQGYVTMPSSPSPPSKTAEVVCSQLQEGNFLNPTPLFNKDTKTIVLHSMKSSPSTPLQLGLVNRDSHLVAAGHDFIRPFRPGRNHAPDYQLQEIRSFDASQTLSDQTFGQLRGHDMMKRLFTAASSSIKLPQITSNGRANEKNSSYQRISPGQSITERKEQEKTFVEVVSARKNAPKYSLPPTAELSSTSDETNTSLTSITNFPLLASDTANESDVFDAELDLILVTKSNSVCDAMGVITPLGDVLIPAVYEITQPCLKNNTVASNMNEDWQNLYLEASSEQVKTPARIRSQPIDIPTVENKSVPNDVVDLTNDLAQNEGSLRWRNAWSTNEDTVPMMAAMENIMRRDGKYMHDSGDFDSAPSSPETHMTRYHTVHHAHHHKRHHRDNRPSRTKTRNSFMENNKNHDDELRLNLQEIFDSLDKSRRETGRPEDLTLMTRQQIRLEMLAMQRELLKHENRYGRPSTKQEKEIMGKFYDRYRMVKRLLADTLSPPLNSSLNRRFDNLERDYDVIEEEFAVTKTITLAPSSGKRRFKPTGLFADSNVHVSGDVDLKELKKQQKEAQSQRKKLRRKLKEFEKEIEKEYGRAVNQSDRVTMATEYGDYRNLKLKLRLLDALITKHTAKRCSL